jgi:hypothetical protein
MIQLGMKKMNPLVRVRLGYPKELSLYFLDGILFQRRQNQEEFIGYCRQGTRVIRTIAADRVRLPINGMVLHIRHKSLLKMRKKRLKFLVD